MDLTIFLNGLLVNKDEKETFSRKSYGKITVCVN